MNNSRHLPSYIVPSEKIMLGDLQIIPAKSVTVFDDWDWQHLSGSIVVKENGYNGLIDNWVYLHAALANSRLPIYVLHAPGKEPSDFQIEDLMVKADTKLPIREVFFDQNDVLSAIYLGSSGLPKMSYKQIYERYLEKDEIYYTALKNYFFAQDINFHKRLRYVNISYWQIVMLVSTLESLLPPPEFCKGKCDKCGKGVNHVINDPGKDWNNLLFNKIKVKKVRTQYREVLDEARYKIRNNTVHNGLAPGNVFWKSPALPDGITEYNSKKSIESYKTDENSLISLIEQLSQACRYTLLNQLIDLDVFPELKGIEVHSVSISANSSPVTINLDNPGAIK